MIKNFLKHFFDQLSLQNIKYRVLLNYQQLPYSIGGSDLDMLVDKSDEVRVLELYEIFKKELND